jgi:hypothetical protein
MYKYATSLSYQGTVFVFAARSVPGGSATAQIGYSILRLTPEVTDDDQAWTDFELLPFPTQIRPAGLRLVTLDIGEEQVGADVPFAALSDGAYVYVFRQSLAGTLLVDRFSYDEVNGKLVVATEVRYRRSRIPDVPSGPGDTFGTTDMDGDVFVEPTTELTFVQNVANGEFTERLRFFRTAI